MEDLLPLAAAWAAEQEARILDSGVALTAAQWEHARKVGVVRPERVRIQVVSSVPVPEHPLLREAGEATGLMSNRTVGLALGYGIFVRREFAGDPFLVAHELVHTAQYERLGGIMNFLRQYLHECLNVGYPAAPLEQEAILATERLRHENA